MHIIRIVIVSLFCTLAVLGFSQSISIQGHVYNSEGQALVGANVFIVGRYDGASTDGQGSFTFQTHAGDSLKLRAEYLGFEAEELNLHHTESENILITLKESFNQLQAVTITAGAFEASDSKRAVALKPLDIVTTAGATGDVVAALQTLPGTTPVGESGRLFVRGGRAEETGTYIDGMLVHEPYTRSAPNTAVRGRFNPFIFSGTTFSTGAYSAEYGQALSSVLLLETKGIELEDEWNLSFMTVGADAAGTKTWDKGSITASVSLIDLSAYAKWVPQNVEFTRLPSMINGSISLRQRTSQTGLLKVYSNLTRSRFGMLDQEPGQEQLERISGGDDNVYLNSSWTEVLSTTWAVKVGAGFSRNEDSKSLGTSRYEQYTSGEHLKVLLIHTPSDKLTLKSGIEQNHVQFKEELLGDAQLLAGVQRHRTSTFTEAAWHLSNDLAIRGGIRMESTRETEHIASQFTWVPRLSLAYKLGDHSQASLAYGVFHQDPHRRTLLYGANFQQERARHLILNYQCTSKSGTFRVEAYDKRYTDLVKFEEKNPERFEYAYTNSGSGYARGIDVWWRDKKSIKNGDYWISYSYLDTERNELDMPQMARPSYAAAHNFSLVYKHWIQDWRSMIGTTLQYSSSRSFDNPNSSSFQDGRIPEFYQCNMNWAYLHREHVIFYAAVTNVLGKEQVFGRRFSTEADEQGVYASETILPMADRFFFIGCFITLSKKDTNQLEKLQ